jgi:hypothetical protein
MALNNEYTSSWRELLAGDKGWWTGFSP